MWFDGLRSLRGNPSLLGSSAAPRASNRCRSSTAAAGSAGAAHLATEWIARNAVLVFGSGMVVGVGASSAWRHVEDERRESYDRQRALANPARGEPTSTSKPALADVPWVQELSSQEGMREVLSAGQMLRRHPVGKLVLTQDHLFDELIRNGQVSDATASTRLYPGHKPMLSILLGYSQATIGSKFRVIERFWVI